MAGKSLCKRSEAQLQQDGNRTRCLGSNIGLQTAGGLGISQLSRHIEPLFHNEAEEVLAATELFGLG